jgi:phage anti-repressor protein
MDNMILVENGLVPIYEGDAGEQFVDARVLHKKLEVKTKFADWIKDRIAKYDFAENYDYVRISEIKETRTGATTRIEYCLKMDTAKEIAMVEGNDTGRMVRRYFIEAERRLRRMTKREVKAIASREASKMVRNMLTDTIRDIIPESPNKKFAYPNYTRLIYKILFNKTVAELRDERGVKKKDLLRDHLYGDELEQIQQYELIITGLIHAGMGYAEIKDILFTRHNEQAKITGVGHILKLAGN